jgi:hypothetical protein
MIRYMTMEPIRIVGVVKEGIGTPRRDAVAMHDRYDVPLQLSRPVTDDEQHRFLTAWENLENGQPLLIEEDRFVLKNTTIQVIRDTFLDDLHAMIKQVNFEVAEAARHQAEQDAADAAHRDEVAKIAENIDWG